MKSRFVSFVSLALVLTLVCSCLLTACAGTGNAGEDSDTTPAVSEPQTETAAPTAGSDTDAPPAETEPAAQTETDAPEETDAPADTGEAEVSGTEPETQPDPGSVPTASDYLTFPRDAMNLVSHSDGCTAEVVEEDGETLVKVVSTGKSALSLTIDYEAVMAKYGLSPIDANEYPVMAVVLRRESLTASSLALAFRAGDMTKLNAAKRIEQTYTGVPGENEFVVFDLAGNADWSGAVREFKLQLARTAKGEGETVYVSAVRFFRSVRDALAAAGAPVVPPDERETMVEPMLVEYEKKNAPDEDASVSLWFDHATRKVSQHDTTSTGRETYVIRMAQDSIEGCQFFLAPGSERSFRLTLSAFTDAEGHTIKTRLFREEYNFTFGVWGDMNTVNMIPDALPPCEGGETVTVEAGKSQGFLIKAYAEQDTPAGLYTAVLDVYDAATGKHIKTADVFCNVWGFSLGEDTRMKTAFNLPLNPIVTAYLNKTMLDYDAWTLYRMYYDFLLENRICAYQLPYDLYNEKVLDYLDNPRVTAFAANWIDGGNHGWANAVLSNKPEWMSKAYFYMVDEPTNQSILNNLRDKSNELRAVYPQFRQVSPFFTDIKTKEGDQIETMKEDLAIWCTKIFAFTPREAAALTGAEFLTTPEQDAQYGTFAERMEKEKAEGDELWTYYCWDPREPYPNWLITSGGCEPIVSLWLNKLVGATGLLYWQTMNYSTAMASAPTGQEIVYGDGVLLYPGATWGIYEPVSCVRLEALRMGIQDYQMLCMLEELAGADACGEMVARMAVNPVCYATDDDYVHAVRVLLGDTLEQLMKNK